MDKSKLAVGISLVAVVIAIIGCFLPVLPKGKSVFGAAVTDVQNTPFPSLSTGQFFLGGNTAASTIGEVVSTGSCATATSTAFAVVNPFTSTSTVVLQSFTGIGNATTTLLSVATSTVTAPASLPVGSLAQSTSIATTSQFYVSGGVTYGSGVNSAGASSLAKIVVGPGEYVVGYATTTTSGMGTNYTGTYSSCNYKLRWTN